LFIWVLVLVCIYGAFKGAHHKMNCAFRRL